MPFLTEVSLRNSFRLAQQVIPQFVQKFPSSGVLLQRANITNYLNISPQYLAMADYKRLFTRNLGTNNFKNSGSKFNVMQGRVAILKVLTMDLNLKDVDLNKMAELIPGFTGAQMKSWVNDAKKIADSKQSKFIAEEHFIEAFVNLIHGTDIKQLHRLQEHQVAIHEAGHALVGHLLGLKVLYVSILPTPNGNGINRIIMPQDAQFTQDGLLSLNCMLLGGRAAESLSGIVQSSSASDLYKVRRNLLNIIDGSQDDKKEADRYTALLYKKTQSLIEVYKGALNRLVYALLSRKVIYGDDIERVINGKAPKNIFVYVYSEKSHKASLPNETSGALAKNSVFKEKSEQRSERYQLALKIIANLLKIDEEKIERFREANDDLEIIIKSPRDVDDNFADFCKHFERDVIPRLRDYDIDAHYIRCIGIFDHGKLIIKSDSRPMFMHLAIEEFNEREDNNHSPKI